MPAPSPNAPSDLRRSFADAWGLTEHASLHVVCLLAAVPGLRLSSGRRTPERNAEVGGSPRSFHLRGRAVDFTGPLPVLQRAAEVVREQRVSAHCTGAEEVLLEKPGRVGQHLHVAW